MASFIERFSELRTVKNVSFNSLADSIGVSVRALKYYGSGERQPTLPVLFALADYFDVSLDYLVGRSDVAERR